MPYSGPFSLITGGLLGQDNPRDDIANWANEQQRKNRAAVGLDANGNPLPANWNPATPAPPDPNQQTAAVTGQALANGQLPPAQEPQATKTPDSLGALLMNLTQYQMREQGFNKAMGMGFAAVSQPRDREMVSKMFDVNEPDVAATGQMEMNAATQQQGQDRMNSLGLMLQDPKQALSIATALNMPGDTPAAKIATLQAAYRADPQGVGRMITQTQQPTPAVANLTQIQRLQGQGANSSEVALLTPSLIAQIGGPAAEKAIGDAAAYRASHKGQTAPWVTPGGVNVDAYNQWSGDQKAIRDNQNTAAGNLSASLQATDTLRQKLTDLQSNPGLQKILSASAESPLKIAARNALRTAEGDDSWKADAVNAVLVNDPEALKAISELKEINGQEYGGAIKSLLGHGLRPSQTEVSAVREGFGQTKNINLFGSLQDYNAQAIAPLLTRLDEAQAEGYGSSGQLKNAPERLHPFIDKTYLTGGKMHLDDGSAPESWESQIHKEVPPDVAAAAQAKMAKDPRNAFAIRDGLRRQGYDVEF